MGVSLFVLFTIATRQVRFFCALCARLHEHEHCPYTQKGQDNFTNNVLIDPLLVMLQLFLFLRLPTQLHTIENERGCDCHCILGQRALLCFPFKAAARAHKVTCVLRLFSYFYRIGSMGLFQTPPLLSYYRRPTQ